MQTSFCSPRKKYIFPVAILLAIALTLFVTVTYFIQGSKSAVYLTRKIRDRSCVLHRSAEIFREPSIYNFADKHASFDVNKERQCFNAIGG